MFSFLNKKNREQKPAFEKFLTSFNAVCELLLTLSEDENGECRQFDPIVMATTAGAIVGAAYIAKKTPVLSGTISESEMGPYLDEINSLFQFVAGSSIREIERKQDKTIDLNSEEAWNIVEKLCYIQEEKMSRYIAALRKVMTKGPGVSVGVDLATAVQKDVFGKEIRDVIFSMSLLKLVSNITHNVR